MSEINETLVPQSDIPRFNVTDNSICAEDGGKSAFCNGGSGGPLIIKGDSASTDLLVGVIVTLVGWQSSLRLALIDETRIKEA